MSSAAEGARSLPVSPVEWRALFSGYADVVLVANSDAVSIDALLASFGPRTLFVFFNKTYKVLSGAFDRPALLVARSSPAGANIVYRREVAKVVEPFGHASFAGIMNLRVSAVELFSAREEFGDRPVGFLDLANVHDGFYPAGHVPTSGFALAVWLAEQRTDCRIHLAGFTARRSDRWKLFKDHDWTFEQTALKLLHGAGRIAIVGRDRAPTPLQKFAERFPEIAPGDVASQALEVLSERLAGTEGVVDQLISVTRFQAKLRDLLRSLKPETRKSRLARSRDAQRDPANALAKSPGSD